MSMYAKTHYNIVISLTLIKINGKKKRIKPDHTVLMVDFGHPMRRADSLEKTLMLGKIEGRREENDRG